jgi:hypothetical protein
MFAWLCLKPSSAASAAAEPLLSKHAWVIGVNDQSEARPTKLLQGSVVAGRLASIGIQSEKHKTKHTTT